MMRSRTIPARPLVRLLPLALVLALAAPVASPATAQYFGRGFDDDVLSPREVVEILRDRGFSRLTRPLRNRDVYVVNAIDPYGVPVRLIVSSDDGSILEAFRQRGIPRGSRIEIDPEDDPRVVVPPPRAEPPRATRPAPQRDAVPRSNDAEQAPAPPTSAKRSPLALPKDPAAPGKTDPSAGTRERPRVIPLTPGVTAPSTQAVPQLSPGVQTSQTPVLPDLPNAPPPAVLDPRGPQLAPSQGQGGSLLDFRSGRGGDGSAIPPPPLD
ncbi:MAG TPA: hypothetical protein PLQ11_06830 [Beijerinckiaceae bacterium]|nr:hypothetical protein [Beijerinckiaceae bacterium]